MTVKWHLLDGKVAGKVKLSIRNCKVSCPEEAIKPYTTCCPHHGLVKVNKKTFLKRCSTSGVTGILTFAEWALTRWMPFNTRLI